MNALDLAKSCAAQVESAAAHRDDQPAVRRFPKLGDRVVVHYENQRLNVQCDIEIPINDKTKQAKLSNGMELAMLAYGATIRSEWMPA